MTSRKTGSERLHGSASHLADPTLLDFWQWAFSNLCSNDVRGVFAEWLVAKLLGLNPPVRDSWGEYDLRTPEGVKIEVKATGWVQVWAPERISTRLVFSSLKGQQWSVESGYSGKATYNADLYIFCVHTEGDQAKCDPLNLDQWRFYLLPRAELVRRDCRSISLTTLSRCARELTAEELRAEALPAIRKLAACGESTGSE